MYSNPSSSAVPHRLRVNLVLFLAGLSLLSVAGSMFDSTFNNFLSDVHHLQPDQRGVLEFPRELPGFLTVFLAGALVFLAETRIAALAALATGLGMVGLAWFGGTWTNMLVTLMLWSVGIHLMMPVRSSIAMELASGAETRGRRLGLVNGVTAAASIGGYGLVWLLLSAVGSRYRLVFTVAGLCAAAAGIILFAMRMPGAHLARPRFVFKRRYWLYYVLSFLFGARKQIFITFGPWVLVKIFHQPAVVFAKLMLVAAGLAILFQPTLGRAIDRFGERRVLMVDAAAVCLVCLGYGYAHRLGNAQVALGILYACFVCDQLLFGTGMARDIYASKIAARKEDIGPTLSMGVTINHAVSMSIPALAGWVWMQHGLYGYERVFLAAAVLAGVMFFFANLVNVPEAAAPAATAPERRFP